MLVMLMLVLLLMVVVQLLLEMMLLLQLLLLVLLLLVMMLHVCSLVWKNRCTVLSRHRHRHRRRPRHRLAFATHPLIAMTCHSRDWSSWRRRSCSCRHPFRCSCHRRPSPWCPCTRTAGWLPLPGGYHAASWH